MKIKRLQLFTSRLQEQKKFYSEVLGFTITGETEDAFDVPIGESLLRFRKGPGNPYYHYAVNIPSNQIEEARKWLSQKVELLTWEEKYVVDFPNWNAKALYFYDAGQNIVELIARRNLRLPSDKLFSIESLRHISEIGLPAKDISQVFHILHTRCGLERYDGDLERFGAVGSETGLFIVVNHAIKKWIPNMDEAFPFPFEAVIENEAGKELQITYQDEALQASETKT